MKRVTIRRPVSPKQTEKTFGVSAKRSRKIDAMVNEALMALSKDKTRAIVQGFLEDTIGMPLSWAPRRRFATGLKGAK